MPALRQTMHPFRPLPMLPCPPAFAVEDGTRQAGSDHLAPQRSLEGRDALVQLRSLSREGNHKMTGRGFSGSLHVVEQQRASAPTLVTHEKVGVDVLILLLSLHFALMAYSRYISLGFIPDTRRINQ